MFLLWHAMGLSAKLFHFQSNKKDRLLSVFLNSRFTISSAPVLFFNLSSSILCCRKSKTKPNGKKPPAEEKKQYLEPEFTKIRVVDFDLKELVVLPREIDLNEWLASNSE